MPDVIETPSFSASWQQLELPGELRSLTIAHLSQSAPSPHYIAGAIRIFCLTLYGLHQGDDVLEVSMAVYYAHGVNSMYLLHIRDGIVNEWSREEKTHIYAELAKVLLDLPSET